MELDTISQILLEKRVIERPLQGSARTVGGGCINNCYCIQSGADSYFLKVNSSTAYPGMFESEAKGLELLKASGTFRVPAIVDQFENDGTAYLVMEYIESARKSPDYWEDCGRQLACMHRQTAESYGLDHHNYIGSLRQWNAKRDAWAEFYLDQRMIPQLEHGGKAGWAEPRYFRQAEAIARLIEDEFPVEPPSLLHGDLWSGNLMTGLQGQPVIVDPAVYYGHREMEIAFTRLFGGFQGAFYDLYQEEWSLKPDFEKRMRIHQLYPLMVHANLFGGHYVQEVREILARFD